MRRIDILAITVGFFVFGGVLYGVLQGFGLEALQAGIWTQGILVVVVILWLGSYLFRVGTKTMTYHSQVRNYEEAWLDKQLEKMTPEELAQIQAELEAEEAEKAKKSP